ncbi:MAG: carbohydrate ABC transporter permease [Ardenticatenaceae bacterium]|nr:carbohydrate ABC transporter permease [Ardenticatenaceae bacterium]
MTIIDHIGRWLNWKRFLLLATLWMFIVSIVFPFYWMVASSFKTRAEIGARETVYVPATLDFSAYRELLDPEHPSFQDFGRNFRNSIIISLPTAMVTVALATLGAYAISRLKFKGKNVMLNSILVIYLFPGVLLIIPLFAMFARIGDTLGFDIQDNLFVLMLTYLAQTLPVGLYMLTNYFRTIPTEIEQAGLIDGCSRMQVIWRITLPLAIPALISVSIYTFMIAWNEFLYAFVFLNNNNLFTLPIAVNTINNDPSPRPNVVMAASTIMTVPVMLLFLGMERFLAEGLAAGGVKG